VKRILGSFIAIALLTVLGWAVWNQHVAIADALTHVSAVKLMLILFVMLPIYPLSVLAWHQLVRGLGGKLTYREALAVWMLSNVARFLPGTIWQWIGRGYLANQYAVTPVQATLSIAYEIALVVVTALVVGLASLPLWPVALHLPWWISLTGLLPALFLWPTTLPAVVRLYQKVRNQTSQDIPTLSWRSLLSVLAVNTSQLLVNGLAIWLLLSLFAPQAAVSILAYAGMYALTWLLGYVTLIAPGGLGVADASLAGLIAAQTSTAIGSAVALLYRALLLVSELIITGLAVALHPAILTSVRSANKKVV